MRGIVVDSGPLIALFDGSDQHHATAVRFIECNRQPLIINLPVVTEVVYVLDFSGEAQHDFLFWAQQALTIDTGTVDDLPSAQAQAQVHREGSRLRYTRPVTGVNKKLLIHRQGGRR